MRHTRHACAFAKLKNGRLTHGILRHPRREASGDPSPKLATCFMLRWSELGPQTATRSRVTRVGSFVGSWESSHGLSVGSITGMRLYVINSIVTNAILVAILEVRNIYVQLLVLG